MIPLFIAIVIPPILNIIGIIYEVGLKTLGDSISGKYERFGLPYNPWPEIFPTFVLICVFLGILSWIIIQIQTLTIIRKRSQIIRLLIAFILSLIGTTIIAFGTQMLSLSWLPGFRDYMLGLPISGFIFFWNEKINFSIGFISLIMASLLRNK